MATPGFKNYLSLIKFSHTIFAMPFAFIGFFYATKTTNTPFNALLFLLVTLCMVFARAAAMGFNRYVDRAIDEKNPRTSIREIPSGVISPSKALAFVVINSLLFVATSWFINTLCFFLSPIALLAVLGYSYTKRFTAMCHLVLGFGLALAPIGAYIAVTGKFDLTPLLFSFAVLCWVSGFDIVYALQDETFDSQHQLNSIPVLLGKKNALAFSLGLHFLSASIIFVVGLLEQLGVFYWIGAGVFCALLVYQHSLVKPNDLSRVNLAFFTTNGIASVVFACFVILSLYF